MWECRQRGGNSVGKEEREEICAPGGATALMLCEEDHWSSGRMQIPGTRVGYALWVG